MSITINGIVCDELDGQYSEQFVVEQGYEGTKRFMCNWTDRYTVANGLIGVSRTGIRNGNITLYEPASHPEIQLAFCKAIQFEPAGIPLQGAKQITWTKAIITATYGSLPWLTNGPNMQIDPTRPLFAEQNIKSSVEMVAIHGRGLKYSSGTKLGQEAAYRNVLVEMLITFHMVPYIPSTAVLYAGSINNGTFLGCAANYLMFNGIDTSYSQYFDGSYNQNVTYSFTFRPIAKWGYGLNPDTGAWEQISTITGGYTIYPSIDFSQIMPVFATA